MTVTEPDIHEHSIVLVGDFNVLIYQPLWFANEGLIRENEAKNATIEIMHRDVVTFSMEWLRFQAFPDRVIFSTKLGSYFEIIRDLVIGTFSLLEHTPIRMLGINYNSHTQMPQNWRWEDFQKSLNGGGLLDSFSTGVVKSLSIENSRDYNALEGIHNVRIEPSSQLGNGILINTNDHYVLREKEPVGSRLAVQTVKEQWTKSSEASKKFREIVLSYGKQ